MTETARQYTAQGYYRTTALIGADWIDADDGATFAVDNPATGEVIAHVAACGTAETVRAISAAEAALPAWRAVPAKEKAKLLRRWFDLVMAHQASLAELLTAEQGKPVAEAMGEIAYGASYIEWFAEEAKRVYGDMIPAPSDDKRILVTREPVGVVACITPWNFPNAMITRKAGCSPARLRRRSRRGAPSSVNRQMKRRCPRLLLLPSLAKPVSHPA